MNDLEAWLSYVLHFTCIQCRIEQEVFSPTTLSPYSCECGQAYHIQWLPDGKVRVEYSQSLSIVKGK